jgi:argininosuccinate lyase
LIKGLPLAYDRDLQEDKALIFATVDRTVGCIEGMTSLLRSLTFDPERLESAAQQGASWATDLAERLVDRGLPFRQAHEQVGALVAKLESDQQSFLDLTSPELEQLGFLASDAEVSDVRSSVSARNTPGGTSAQRVSEQIAALRSVVAGSRC